MPKPQQRTYIGDLVARYNDAPEFKMPEGLPKVDPDRVIGLLTDEHKRLYAMTMAASQKARDILKTDPESLKEEQVRGLIRDQLVFEADERVCGDIFWAAVKRDFADKVADLAHKSGALHVGLEVAEGFVLQVSKPVERRDILPILMAIPMSRL